MISVVIPLYNVEKYVIDCLDSLSKQTYTNFELIIINDGSTDRSPVIVQEYIKQSNMKIKLIHQENAGVSAARNRGIEESIGDYICFLDPDDLISPIYLEKMVYTIEKINNCDLVVCGFKSVPEKWNMSSFNYVEQPVEIFDSYTALRKFLYHEMVTGVWSLLVKKEILMNHKLRFAEGYRYSEDMEFIWKIIANAKNVAYDKSKLYIYRTRISSAMSLVDDKRLDGYKLMQGLEQYFNENRPDFSAEFKKFGVARWVWATLWQITLACDSYSSFVISSEKFQPKIYMKYLLNYPNKKVKISSLLYVISSRLYYIFVKKVLLKNVINRQYYKS